MNNNVVVVDKIISDDRLLNLIDKTPSIVILYSEWSTSYLIMKNIYKKIESEFENKIRFFYINNKSCPETRAEFGIMFFPTCLLYKKSKLIDIIEGVVSLKILSDRINMMIS